MIKRIFNSRLPVLAYNPFGSATLSYFKELFKSGCLPVFDTEFMDHDFAVKMIEKLEKSGILYGIRIFTKNSKLFNYIEKKKLRNLNIIIAAYFDKDDLNDFSFPELEAANIVETTDIEINENLKACNAQGLILKGFEAGGKVSNHTSFVLMQWYLTNTDFPVIVQGGAGLYTSAGILAAGASGIVLDSQLYLTDEAPISKDYKNLISNLEEFDSEIIGRDTGTAYRCFSKLATKIVKDIKLFEKENLNKKNSKELVYEKIRDNFTSVSLNNEHPVQSLFFLGQDASFAKSFVKKSSKLKSVIDNLIETTSDLLNKIEDHNPIRENTKFCKISGCRLPIVQGPMANISDNSKFAKAVYENGGLPFFALGSLPETKAQEIIKEGKEDLPVFGAGLIGIEELNQNVISHMEIIKKEKVKFALFAGGTPSQINELEDSGIKTWIHTPSIGMLDNAVSNGCRGVILEGTEAGGHVGKLTSLVLWELGMVHLMGREDIDLSEITLVFAGGIGTAKASSLIAGISSSISQKGGAIGIQLGTPYLFSSEIVKTGALKDKYQEVISNHYNTMLMGTTVGLAARTIETPFSKKIIENENIRIKDKLSLNERKRGFEEDNIGSLLIAAKGLRPLFDSKTKKVSFEHFNDEECFEKGNYCVGDSLAFHTKAVTIESIHKIYMDHEKDLVKNLNKLEIFSSKKRSLNDEIAVIGMGCIYPDANSVSEFWENIISKKYSIKEISDSRLDKEIFYDEDRKALDKSYSKIAGIADKFKFNPGKFDLSEDIKISRSQEMLLEACHQALESAGIKIGEDSYLKKSTIIIGSCLGNEMSHSLNLKYFYPELKYHLDQIDEFKNLSDEEKEKVYTNLKDNFSNGNNFESPDSAALNIEASRLAQWLKSKGPNYVVDAACATSFAAIDCGIRELLSGSTGLVIAGGVNSSLSPESFTGFSKMGALSNNGSFPFDERADGFVLGEGAGIVVLKRMKDAIRDNDNILAVIKSMAGSSDGKGKAIAAPNAKGQELALLRTLEKASFTPSDIDFIEAHGTSTIIGDEAEVSTLKNVYSTGKSIGVSSVKSQIGHLLGGAGAAGFIKTILAINNKILPPSVNFENISPKFLLDDSPLYIIDKAKEWKKDKRPRRGAVSSYGFGGINFHAIVEEYDLSYKTLKRNFFDAKDLNPDSKRIVISGLGTILPGAKNQNQLWEKLLSGKKDFIKIPELIFHNEYYAKAEDEYRLPDLMAGIVDDYEFNSLKYKIPPNTLKSIDRAQLFALDAANQAVEEACQGNIDSMFYEGNKTGVILGAISGGKHVENIIRTRTSYIENIIENTDIDKDVREKIKDNLGKALRQRFHENCEDTTPGLLSNIVSGRVANYFNCNGPNFIVDAACASSGIAMDAAMKSILSGDNEIVLTGGVDTNFYPGMMMVFKRLGLLSDEDTKIFDKRSKGVNLSEAGVVMVMTTYETAVKKGFPILAEISGMEFSSNPSYNLYSPSQGLIKETAENCYSNTPVFKNSISHIDVFGFSSLMMDQIENQGLDNLYDHELSFGSVKPELGYFKGANPAVAAAKLILSAKYRTLLPNRNYNDKNSIVKKSSNLKPNEKIVQMDENSRFHLAANIFGFGANHGHMVVSSIPSRLLNENLTKVEDLPETSIPEPLKGSAALLCGQGSQYPEMMKDLYETETIIKSTMDRAEAIFKEERGYSLLDIMFSNSPKLNSTENTQPAIFTASSAIFEFLKSKGFYPEYFIGHSIGEYTALYASGALDFENAMKLLLTRSKLMKEADEEYAGKILIVFKERKTVKELIEDSGIDGIYVSNINSLNQTGVSGFEDKIDLFCSFLSKKGIFNKKLDLTGAFHTPILLKASSKLGEYLKNIKFNKIDLSKIISNATGEPYPNDEEKVKELLVKQIISPVEFVKSVQKADSLGVKKYIEVGTGKILSGLLKYMDINDFSAFSSVESKDMEKDSINKIEEYISDIKSTPVKISEENTAINVSEDDDFNSFIKNNKEDLDKVLYQEYLRAREKKKIERIDKLGFYTGSIAISGVSIGLPGTENNVFNGDNFERLISGKNLIESLPDKDKDLFADKNISRIVKSPTGNLELKKIGSIDDVIQLAGRLGYFDLKDYGVEYDYDIAISLAFAAGIEALKDAGIPLVKKSSQKDKRAPLEKFELPDEMQDSTGVIMTSLFQGMEKFVKEMEAYYAEKFISRPYAEMENIYCYLMENLQSKESKVKLTDWFFEVRKKRNEYGEYEFDKNLIFNLTPLGSAHFAQHIKAKGPNLNISGACASTTQACGVAEDWIRSGRCKRVIIIGGEGATTKEVNQWIGSGFLSLGAASVKKDVFEASKPFDMARQGTILGSGAVSLIVERRDSINKRGLAGQAEILGTCIGNSAFHSTGIDQDHLAHEMKSFLNRVSFVNDLDIEKIADKTIFMSHETYTPAKGGSADAEVKAIRSGFGASASKVKITNTKGYTGHTLGAAIEDAVMVKCLQHGDVPKIANLENIPYEFSDLRLNDDAKSDYEYGLHFSAGFGSHFAFLFVKKINEKSKKNNSVYTTWLKNISGEENPELKIINNTLCLEALDVEKKEPVPVKKSGSTLKRVAEIIARQTGYGEDMLEPGLDLEADLGIDTVKQVEIFGKISAELNLEVPENLKLRELNTIEKLVAYIDEKTGNDSDTELKANGSHEDQIKEIISRQTGYGVDMLESNLDLEADLGIDTVKQVEIFGKISSELDLEVPENLKLRELNTIAKLAAYIDAGKDIIPIIKEAAKELDHETRIKEIVARQTGYSVEMLDVNLDLEADLGIDTVKQVEIFGKISSELDIQIPENLKLRELNTIAKLALYLQNQESGLASESDTKEITPVINKEKEVKRFIVEAEKFTWEDSTSNIFFDKTFLITRDESGFSDRMIKTIIESGGDIVTLGKGRENDFTCDFKDHDKLESIIEKIKEKGDIEGFIHLAPIDGYFKKEFDTKDVEEFIKPFFIITKGFAKSLKNKGSIISSISFNSVVFPYSSVLKGRVYSTFAGISGIAKSISKEFEKAIVKIVDFNSADPLKDKNLIIDEYIKRLNSKERFVETGVSGKNTYKLTMKEEAIKKSGSSFIKPKSKIVVSGGARGITFEILNTLSDKYSPELIILGRSDIESLDKRFKKGVLDESTLISLLRGEMKDKKPVEIKKAAKRIMGFRESLDNIESLRSHGIKVNYHSCDVTDLTSIEKIADKYGKIDGIIHAAGLEESQFIEKKELSSFNRVFDTKVKGGANLLKAFEEKGYNFFIGFSSVTARFGNEGQSDYTGANDMLGRMLDEKSLAYKNRTYKVMSWTAWKDAGMATNETVMKVLESRGLTFLPLNKGIEFFMSEIKDSKRIEAVFTGIDSEFDKDSLMKEKEESLEIISPFLDSIKEEKEEKIIFSRLLDLKRDLFLKDHSMQDIPLFLGAAGIETMAEAAEYACKKGEKRLSHVTDFAIPYGIKILKQRPKNIEIETVKENENSDIVKCRIFSRFENHLVTGEKKLHYKGNFHFTDKDYKNEKIDIPKFCPVEMKDNPEEVFYHPKRLFMHGSFKTIKEVLSFVDNTLVTRVRHNDEREFFKGESYPKFLTDLIMTDAMFQTGGIFEFLTSNNLVLPFEAEKFRFVQPVKRGVSYLCITKKVLSNEKTESFDMFLVDEDGNLYMEAKNFQMIRLARLEKDFRIDNRFKISA